MMKTRLARLLGGVAGPVVTATAAKADEVEVLGWLGPSSSSSTVLGSCWSADLEAGPSPRGAGGAATHRQQWRAAP